MTTNTLPRVSEADKPLQPAERDQLLAWKLSAGVSASAAELFNFARQQSDASLLVCHELARVLALLMLKDVPNHLTVRDVRRVLDDLRQKGGRRENL